MKVAVFVLSIVLTFVVAFTLGFNISNINEIPMKQETSIVSQQEIQTEKKSVAGIYYTANWTGGSATLILNEDGTCKHPLGMTGTYICKGDKVSLIFGNEAETSFVEHVAYIVEDGIILQNHFLEKKK